jgi:hypothetical protein
VSGQPCKERSGTVTLEVVADERLCRLEGSQAEARHEKWVTRDANHRAKTIFCELAPVIDDRLYKVAPGCAVDTEFGLSSAKIAFEYDSGAVIEWMSQRCFAVDPFQSVVCQGERVEKWRTRCHGVHGGAEVMTEARESERQCAGRTTRLSFGFEDLDLKSRLRQDNGSGESIGTCSDHVGAAHRCKMRQSIMAR